MDRIDELFNELNQEVIETRNQTIKTDNSLRNLATDIKAINRRQEAYERRFVYNSIGAYIIFASLSFVGLLLFFNASAARNQLDAELVAQQTTELERRIHELESELERRRHSEREAYEFFELLASGRRDEVVERFSSVQGRLLDRATIELFRREIDRIRHDLAGDAYRAGVQHFDGGRWQEARDALTRSMAYVDIAHYTPDLHYRLGESLYQLSDFAGAIRYLDLTIGSGALARTEAINAHFHRADALRRLERFPEAVEAYQLFVRRYDGHSWANTARERITSIQRRISGE